MQLALTRTLVRTRSPHFHGFLLLDLRQCALRLRARAVFLFNLERSERIGRKYRVYNDDEGSGYHKRTQAGQNREAEYTRERKIPPEIGYVRKERTPN